MSLVFGAETTLYLIPPTTWVVGTTFTEEETEAQGGYTESGMTGI